MNLNHASRNARTRITQQYWTESSGSNYPCSLAPIPIISYPMADIRPLQLMLYTEVICYIEHLHVQQSRQSRLCRHKAASSYHKSTF